MPAVRRLPLTKKDIDHALQARDTQWLWDATVPGLVLRIRRTSATWYVSYRAPSGKQCRLAIGRFGALTLDQARTLARQQLGYTAAGGDPSADRQRARAGLTVAQLWTEYAAAHATRWRASTAATNAGRYRDHIAPEFGALPLASLARLDVARWHTRLGRTMPVGANRAMQLLRAMLNHALRLGLLEGENPAARIPAHAETPRDRYLSAEEVLRLLDAISAEEALCRGERPRRVGKSAGRGGRGLREAESQGISSHCANLFRLFILTGARRDELRALRWDEIDWQARVISLPHLRSKTGRKLLALSDEALAILAQQRPQTCDFVFVGNRPGAPINNVAKPWARVLRRAGLEAIRLHDLRHTFASLAIAQNLTLEVIGKALGHASPQTTARYAHLATEAQHRAAATVADAIAARRKSPK